MNEQLDDTDTEGSKIVPSISASTTQVLTAFGKTTLATNCLRFLNGKEATVSRVLYGSAYPG